MTVDELKTQIQRAETGLIEARERALRIEGALQILHELVRIQTETDAEAKKPKPKGRKPKGKK